MAIEETDYQDMQASPARSKGFKPKRGLGQAVTRKRRLQAEALQEQIAKRKAAEREAARNELDRLRKRANDTKSQNETWFSNLLRSVIGNQTALLRSWGHPQPINGSVSNINSNVNAFTDFRKIVVQWPARSIPDRFSSEKVLDTVAQIKGVVQHEMGHIRFTTPFAVVMNESTTTGNHHMNLIQKCWNMLEDQRMESLVVEAVPRISNYFGTMVANIVLGGASSELPMEQAWLMLAGRTYLPVPVLRKSYEMFDQFCDEQGIEDGAEKWWDIVQSYKAAATSQAIMDATETALDFIQSIRANIPQGIDKHEVGDPDGGSKPEDTARPKSSILDLFDDKRPTKASEKGAKDKDGSEQQEQQEGSDSGEAQGSSEEEDGEAQGQSEEGESESESESEGQGSGSGNEEGSEEDSGEEEGGSGGSSADSAEGDDPSTPNQSDHGNGTEQPTSTEDLRDLLSDMGNSFSETIRQDKDLREMVRNANSVTDASGLPEYPGVGSQEMPSNMVESAKFTSVGVEQALNSFVTNAAPIWQNRKEVGVIDPLAYRTKATGDRNYRRHLEDRGNIGLDVHVSMLCDVSASMVGNPIQALSESLYATALACQKLGIGATYTLWSSDHQNYRVWSDGNATPTLWPALGGTDPTAALDDLDTHNPEEASNHLVIVFTDGEWSAGFPGLQRWAAPGRTFVLVRYGAYGREQDLGADSHIGITDVRDLPHELTKSLIDVLDQGGW